VSKGVQSRTYSSPTTNHQSERRKKRKKMTGNLAGEGGRGGFVNALAI